MREMYPTKFPAVMAKYPRGLAPSLLHPPLHPAIERESREWWGIRGASHRIEEVRKRERHTESARAKYTLSTDIVILAYSKKQTS